MESRQNQCVDDNGEIFEELAAGKHGHAKTARLLGADLWDRLCPLDRHADTLDGRSRRAILHHEQKAPISNEVLPFNMGGFFLQKS